MNEALYQYLSDEYMKCVAQEDELIQEKYQLQSKQRKFEENLYLHAEDESKRQLFSPLILTNSNERQELSQEQFQLSTNGKQLTECEKNLKELDKKKTMLKGFIHDLTQQSMQFDEFVVPENEQVLFFPAFYELLEHTDECIPDITFSYKNQKISSKCLMTIQFLRGWKNLFSHISNSLLLSELKFEVMQDKNKIYILIKGISKVPIGKNAMKRLETVLEKDYFLQSWNKNSFDLQIVLK